MKKNQPAKVMRSTTAPEIRATVMMANMSWNMEKANSGIVGALGWTDEVPMPENKAFFKSPIHASRPDSVAGSGEDTLKIRLYWPTTQKTDTTAADERL